MQAEARRLGLRGWVRNRPDGSVEAVVDGNATDVRRLVDWARSGPPGARVRDVVEQPEPDDRTLESFDVRH
jgi:acylphosphatase